MPRKKQSAFIKLPAQPLPVYQSSLRLEHLKDFAVGDTFIESGTGKGDGIMLAKDYGFKYIHSIELDRKLFNQSYIKFLSDQPFIKLYQGFSPHCIETILTDHSIYGKEGTFWLDAHDHKSSPIIQELDLIQTHSNKNHTIFINDRRLFGKIEFGFVKEEAIIAKLKTINPDYSIINLDGYVHGDILCAFIRRNK